MVPHEPNAEISAACEMEPLKAVENSGQPFLLAHASPQADAANSPSGVHLCRSKRARGTRKLKSGLDMAGRNCERHGLECMDFLWECGRHRVTAGPGTKPAAKVGMISGSRPAYRQLWHGCAGLESRACCRLVGSRTCGMAQSWRHRWRDFCAKNKERV